MPLGKHRYWTGCEWSGKKHRPETIEKMKLSHAGLQVGEKNSQFGTCWIYSSETKQNKKINKDDLEMFLKQGWIKGRKIKQ